MSPNAGDSSNSPIFVNGANDDTVHLLNLRLAPPTAIIDVAAGSFTATGLAQLAVIKAGGILEIQQFSSPASGSAMVRQLRVDTHSTLRACVAVRRPGEEQDYLAVTSDAGTVSLLDLCKQYPTTVAMDSFGKTGIRRAVPGQYLAADPKGRALLVSAVEKRQLVYVVTHDSTVQLASPLEAHRSRTITVAVTGVDQGYDNPVFAVLELQYPDLENELEELGAAEAPSTVTIQLAYYELDLGLNHVSRTRAVETIPKACCLVSVPGGTDGPGGVLVGGEDWVEYHSADKSSKPLRCPVPRRQGQGEKGLLVTQLTLHKQKKNKFFGMAQTEVGDVYKVSFTLNDDKTAVSKLQVALLDTLPMANALHVSKLGLLFAASEFGDHQLYQFERIDLPNAPVSGSVEKDDLEASTKTALEHAATFTPNAQLTNLRRLQTLPNPSPTTGLLVGELAGTEVAPQVYTLTGRANLRILRHGAAVTEWAVSELPGVPGGIYTVKENNSDGNAVDKYLVLSFVDATLVLSIGESIEEVSDSGFLTEAPTLCCTALANGTSYVQVYPSGVRQITPGSNALQWLCPGLKRIECASANPTQVLIAMAGGEVNYFEFDSVQGKLAAPVTHDLGADVCCLSVGDLLPGATRSTWAVVGCRDQTMRVLKLVGNKGSGLTQTSSMALSARPHSVLLQTTAKSCHAEIGLDDGSVVRVNVDPVTGALGASPTRRFLGARPVSVSRLANGGSLLLSSRPWVRTASNQLAPLSYVPLDHGCALVSAAIPEGIVATAGTTMRILSVESDPEQKEQESVGQSSAGVDEPLLNSRSVPLRYTPRQMALINVGGASERKVAMVIVESEHNTYGQEERKALEGGKTKKEEDDAMDMDEGSDDEGSKKAEDGTGATDDDADARATFVRGPVPNQPGKWGSCVRLVDPSNGCKTLECIELGRDEAALCCASVRFHSKGSEPLLAVGAVTKMTLHPIKVSASHILIYRIVDGERLQLLHRTALTDDGPVLALAHFQGRLLAGVGSTLRLFELGQRQLLSKAHRRGIFRSPIRTLVTANDRVYASDLLNSVHVLQFDSTTQRFGTVALDHRPMVVATEVLDWDTVAVSDKFGNISVLRVPRGASSAIVDESRAALWEQQEANRLELQCQYHVGEIVTGLTRALLGGATEAIVYVTVTGRIGALLPLQSRAQLEFYSQLEGAMRKHSDRLTGRDPLAYRSYYAPVLNVKDGELCESFRALKQETQQTIADELERSIPEILKKLEDTRNTLL